MTLTGLSPLESDEDLTLGDGIRPNDAEDTTGQTAARVASFRSITNLRTPFHFAVRLSVAGFGRLLTDSPCLIINRANAHREAHFYSAKLRAHAQSRMYHVDTYRIEHAAARAQPLPNSTLIIAAPLHNAPSTGRPIARHHSTREEGPVSEQVAISEVDAEK